MVRVVRMPNLDWLPKEYRVPEKAIPSLANNDHPIQHGTELKIFVDLPKLQNMLAETAFCKQQFGLAATKGYNSYYVQGCFNNDKFAGINIVLQKK